MYYSSVNKFIKYSALASLFLFFSIASTSHGDSGGRPTDKASANNSTQSAPQSYVKDEVLVRYKSSAFLSTKSGYLIAAVSSQVLPSKLISDGVVAVETIFPKSLKVANAFAASTSSGIDKLNRWRVLKLADGVAVDSIIQKLLLDPDIEHAQPNYEYSINATPNDPLFSQLWGLQNIGQVITKDSGPALDVAADCVGNSCGTLPDENAVSGADIKAVQAWDINTGDNNRIIAVIDTGVDYNHPDLAANIWINTGEKGNLAQDGIDNDDNGYVDDLYGYDFANNDVDPMDDNGHGTHVAGTIAGHGNNGIGVTGVNWNAKIMSLKFLRSDGVGVSTAAMKAIDYAKFKGVKITNNSWGGPVYDQALFDAIAISNALFVVAAGNSESDNDRGNAPGGSTSYPAAYDLPNIITVSATDNNDEIAPFSSYGFVTSEVGAPGVNILSTVPTGTCQLCNAGVPAYTFLSGTSMATPHVAGAVGLIMSKWPDLSLADHRTILQQSSDTIPALSDKVTSGRINIYNALRSTFLIENTTAKQNVLAGSNLNYSIKLSSLAGASANLSLSLETGNTQITGNLSQSTVAIGANGSATITANISVNSGISQGKYKIKVNASDANGIQASAYLLVEVVPDVDLVSLSINTTATKIDANDRFVVTHAVQNTGSVDVTGTFVVKYYLSIDTNVNSDDVRYYLGLQRFSNGLAAGAIDSLTTTLQVPIASVALLFGVPVGTYYIRAVVDSNKEIVELNEENNTGFSDNTILVAHEADLVITNVTSASSSFYTGEFTTTIDVTIKNQGVTGSVGTCLRTYLSTDSIITTTDTAVSRKCVGRLSNYLAPGASATLSVRGTIPSTLATGNYFLGAYADSTNSVVETNENNNASTGVSVQLIRDLDVVVSAMSLSSNAALPGDRVNFSWSFRNQGQSPTYGRGWRIADYYLSTDSNITTEDIRLGGVNSRLGENLAGGATKNYTGIVTIPANTLGGSYFIGIIVDPNDVQDETNEINNTASVAVTIQ